MPVLDSFLIILLLVASVRYKEWYLYKPGVCFSGVRMGSYFTWDGKQGDTEDKIHLEFSWKDAGSSCWQSEQGCSCSTAAEVRKSFFTSRLQYAL